MVSKELIDYIRNNIKPEMLKCKQEKFDINLPAPISQHLFLGIHNILNPFNRLPKPKGYNIQVPGVMTFETITIPTPKDENLKHELAFIFASNFLRFDIDVSEDYYLYGLCIGNVTETIIELCYDYFTFNRSK